MVPILGLRRTVRADAAGLGTGRSSEELATLPDDKRVTPGARGLLPLEGTVKIPATLPLRCSLESALLALTFTTPATLPRRCSIKAFCLCFTVSMDRTCSMAAGSSRPIVKPMTAVDIGVVPEGSNEGALTSVFKPNACGPPLTVTRRFLDGGARRLGGDTSVVS